MNIFFLHSDPKVAAQMHCDKHCPKMILESCQLLSTAHRILDGVEYQGITKSGRKIRRWDLRDANLNTFIYTATHINHPSAIWCRSGLKQYNWLASLTKELCIEYTYRYGKTHKCEAIGLVDWFVDNVPKNIKDIPWTEATPAMPDDCKVPGDSVASYRKYYIQEKQRMLTWRGKVREREVPYWAKGHELKPTDWAERIEDLNSAFRILTPEEQEALGNYGLLGGSNYASV